MSASVRWTPWASTVRGPSSPVSRSTSIGVRPPCRVATCASSAFVSQAWTWTPASDSAASSPTARSWSSDSRYALCGHTKRSPGAVLPSSSRAQRIRTSNGRRSAPGNSTNTGPDSRWKPVDAATAEATSGKKYMSRAVVIPARRHSAIASAVPAATDCSDRTAPSAGISRPRKPVQVEVVGEPAEHRHREVGVGVDEAGQDEPTGGVDDDARRRRIGVCRPDRRDGVTVDDDVAAWMHGARRRPSSRPSPLVTTRSAVTSRHVTGAAGSPAAVDRCAPPRRRRRP